MAIPLNEKLALVTLTEFKAFIGKTGTAEDDKLTQIINQVGQIFNTYLGRVLIRQEIVEIKLGRGRCVVWLKGWPIVEAAEFKIELLSDYDEVEKELLKGEDYSVEWQTGRVAMGKGVFEEGRKYRISYTGGVGEFGAMPEDIKLAAMIEGLILYQRQEHKSFGETSRGIAGQSVQMTEGLIVSEVKEIIDKYK